MATNQDFIDAYKAEDKIISDYYKIKDKSGNIVVLDGVVNPLMIDNRQLMSPTDDQTVTPHCAGYSAATLVESLHWKKTGIIKQFDSHQVYALAKIIDGDVNSEGTYLEASLKAVLYLCNEDKDFKYLANAKIGQFYNTNDKQTIEATKLMLHKYDFIQVGFNIDEGWYYCNKDNYVLKQRGASQGGHAVNLVGYDNTGFYVLNQWGTSWGAKGYGIIPYDLFLKQFIYGAYLYNYSI